MKKNYYLGNNKLTFDILESISNGDCTLKLSAPAKKRIDNCRKYLDKKIENTEVPVYGITTGFGSLCNKTISHYELEQLQKNLIMSHACSTGDEVAPEIIRLMLVLKAYALSLGYSGAHVDTVQFILNLYNNEVLPVVYDRGSLGASGDLAPLSNLFLPLIGEGEVNFEGEKQKSSTVIKKLGWKPIKLQSKEGLALLNGTQFMSAHGVFALLKSFKLSKLADLIGAISLDAFDGRIEPFDEKLQQIRPHQGQMQTAANICAILDGSELILRNKKHVQDPYSFRCIPQVHGATKDAINYVANVVATEINSVTDNPTVFAESDQIISGGNFHGQPLALAFDFLAMALAELGNISERRTAQLILGNRSLPEFLVAKPGLNSGLMIPQYAAASMVSQNKIYAHPASVDSIVSSNGQEDHVSMGANAATKLLKIIDNIERILAIELMNATQALDFRRPQKSSPYIEEFVAQYRNKVKFIDKDKVMYKEIEATLEFLRSGDFE
jgi:histidine ammonia-lyase